jgi:NAD+ diphosphatase
MGKAAGFAFAGSGLDRAAALRDTPESLAAARGRGTILPMWRGNPLIAGDAPGWLWPGHPALAHAGQEVFLGLDGDTPRFAADISAWSPDAGAEAVEAGLFDPVDQTHPALPEDHRFADLRSCMVRLSARDAELAAIAKALLGWHRTHRFCAACGAPSAAVKGGWQRSCPACGAQHFPRTDPVVIMLVTQGNRTLVGRSPGWPPGMYSCLAGFVEPGETIEAAVRREVAEETGVPVGRVRYIASQPWPWPASLMIGCRAEASDDRITLDPAELEDARWITREDMVAVLDGRHPDIRPARRGAIARALIEGWLADRLDQP